MMSPPCLNTQYEIKTYASSYVIINILADIVLTWSDSIYIYDATDLVINGNGYTLYGADLYFRSFYFEDSSVTLRDIYFYKNFEVRKCNHS